ncbi:MAG: choice-of-anchor N protein [bacterium]|nr:choice-of-anchor N protein [bacterium]
MIKKMFFKKISILVITLVGLVGITPLSYAIPSLQLYIPGSTYDSTTESWTTYDSNFELQVLGASSPRNADYITNLKLYIAIISAENGMSGAYIKINSVPISLNIYGTPPRMPPHGIFPTYYCEYSLPDLMVSTAGETIYNYNPGESGFDMGDIHSLQIDWSGYTFVHFDAVGTVMGNKGQTWNRKAPFSHDAEAVIPEPTSMLFLGIGLLGATGFIKRRKKI